MKLSLVYHGSILLLLCWYKKLNPKTADPATGKMNLKPECEWLLGQLRPRVGVHGFYLLPSATQNRNPPQLRGIGLPVFFRWILLLHPTHFGCVVVRIRVRWASVECDIGWTTNVHVRCHYSKLWTTNITNIAVRDEDGSLKNSCKTYLVVDREASEGPLLTT